MAIPDFKFKGAPLSEENSKRLISLYMSKGSEKPLAEDKKIAEIFSSQVLLKRIQGYGLPFMVSNFFFLMSIVTFIEGNPGKVMMQLWLCHQEWKKTGKTFFNIDDWAEMFPWGTPTDEECRNFWDSQKDPEEPLGNMLDNLKYWK